MSKSDSKAKGKGWIAKAAADIKHPGICTGSKFGSKSCPPGSPQNNLAKVFRKAAAKRKGK